MRANINTVYEGVFDIVNKNQVGGYLSSDEFNRYASVVLREWINEAYLNYDTTQNTTDNLQYIKVTYTPIVTSDTQITLPEDYMHLVALSTRVYVSQTESYLSNIEILSDSEYRQREMVTALKPSKNFPAAVLKDGYIQLYPLGLASVANVDYLKQPITPEWGYTVVNGVKVYDSASSTDFDVPIQHTEDLIQRIVKKLGFQIRDEAMVAYDSETGKPKQ